MDGPKESGRADGSGGLSHQQCDLFHRCLLLRSSRGTPAQREGVSRHLRVFPVQMMLRYAAFTHLSDNGREKASMQNVTAARLLSTDSPLPPPPSFKCNVLRESLSVDSRNISRATLKKEVGRG
jgi:hypothetical protein